MPKALPPIRRTVAMEESMLLSMARSPQFLAEFAFLSRIKAYSVSKTAGCSTCGGDAKSVQRQNDFDAAKTAIWGLSDDKRRKLKQMLNADTISVSLRIGNSITTRQF
jgi:hypothetical protein